MARVSLEGGKVIPTSVPPTASDLAHEKWERIWERHLKALTNMETRDTKVLSALQRAMDKRRSELEVFRSEVLESSIPEDKKLLLTSRIDSVEGTFRTVEDYVIKNEDTKGSHAADLTAGIMRTESALQAYRKPYFDSFVSEAPAAAPEADAAPVERTPDQKRETLRAMSDAAVSKAKSAVADRVPKAEEAPVTPRDWNAEVKNLYGALGTERDQEARAAMREVVSQRRRELEELRAASETMTLAPEDKKKIQRAIENAEEAMDTVNGRVVEGTAIGEEARSMFTPLQHADMQLQTFRAQYMGESKPAAEVETPNEKSEPVAQEEEAAPEAPREPAVQPPDYRAQLAEQLKGMPAPAPEAGQFARADGLPADTRSPLEKATAQPFTRSEERKLNKEALMATVNRFPLEIADTGARVEGLVPGTPVEVTEDGFRTNRIHERVTAQKTAMDAAIKNYAAKHKETYQKQGFFKKIMGAGRKAEGFEQDAASKKALDEVRLNYLNSLEASVREELKNEGRSPEEIDKIAARYTRMARLQQVSKPYLEAVRDARLEAREGSKNLFEKVIGKYQAWEQGKEAKLAAFLEGKTLPLVGTISPEAARRSAQVIRKLSRVVGFAALGTGAVTAGGFLGIGAIGAGTLGWLGTRVAGISLGSALGWVSGDVYEATGGARAAGQLHEVSKQLGAANAERAKERKAAEAIVDPIARQKKLNELDKAALEEFAALDEAARHGSFEAIQRKKILVENLTAAVASGSITSILSADIPDAVHTGGPGVNAESVQGTPDGVSSADSDTTLTAGTTSGSGVEGAASVEANPITAITDRSLSIEGDINNADRLIGHFGVKMQTAFGENPPPSVAKLIELLSTKEGASLLGGEDQATLALHLQEADGSSAIMQPGDTIRLTNEGDIVIERPGNPEFTHTIIDRTGAIHTDHSIPMDGDGRDAAPTEAAPATAPATSGTTVESAPAQSAESLRADAAAVGDTSAPPSAPSPAESAPVVASTSIDLDAPPPTPAPEVESAPAAPADAAPSAPAEPLAAPGTRQFGSIDDYNAQYMGPAPAESVTSAFTTTPVNEVVSLPGWSSFQGANSWQFFREMPEAGSEASAVRRELMEVVRESGLGPRPEETLSQYLERADRALVENPFGDVERVNGIDIVPGPAIYEDNSGRLIVHGGDYNARMLVAIDYLRDNASANLLVEDPGADDYLEFSRDNVARGNVPVSRVPVRGIRGFTDRVF